MTPGVCFTRACGCSRLTSFPGLRVARMIRRGGTSVHSDERIDAFYKTRAWKRCRASYLASVGGLCERCLKRGLIVPADQVHHKIKLTSDNAQCPALIATRPHLDLSKAPVKCEIFDVKGQQLKAKTFSATSAQQMWQDMSAGLKPGVYLMRYGIKIMLLKLDIQEMIVFSAKPTIVQIK